MAHDSAVPKRNSLASQSPGLLLSAVCHQLPGGTDHPPPGKTGAPSQNVADGSSRPRVAGSASDLAVADDLPAPEIAHSCTHGVPKRRLLRHPFEAYRSRSSTPAECDTCCTR